jgi:hypothetical protein
MQCFGELDDPPEYVNKLGNKLPDNLQHNMNEYRKAKGKRVAEASNLEASTDTPTDDEHKCNVAPGACFASLHEASVLELRPSSLVPSSSDVIRIASQDVST